MSICRLCHGSEFERARLVKYGPWHYAHPQCAVRAWGAAFLDRLTPFQIRNLPYRVLRAAGLLEEAERRVKAETASQLADALTELLVWCANNVPYWPDTAKAKAIERRASAALAEAGHWMQLAREPMPTTQGREVASTRINPQTGLLDRFYRLNDRQRATMLAALRYWQRSSEQGDADADDEFEPIGSNEGKITPLDRGEIEALFERLTSEAESAEPNGARGVSARARACRTKTQGSK